MAEYEIKGNKEAMILHGQSLVDNLRELCDKAKKRIWIVSPFIGSWNEVMKVIGINWSTNESIDIKILTDIRNERLLDYQTFKQFQYKAEIKTINGLHAKIYICDNDYLLTSANLTGMAFSRRYEVGILKKVDTDLLELFDAWWSKAQFIDSSWLPKKPLPRGKDDTENNYSVLPKLWKLPEIDMSISVFKNYNASLNAYSHFKDCYLKQINNQQILKGLPIMLEIDAFLNYLFHEHPGKPTKKYYKDSYRKLSDKKRESELKKYITNYKSWLKKNPEYEKYRNETVQLLKNSLSVKKINSLGKKDINEIINSFHCMNSLPLNKSKFLNSKNNSTTKIRKSWKNLLHNNSVPIEIRMEKCNEELYSFGKSAIQELIAWYFPNKYPLINTNSSSGLKFFGYDVKTY